MSRYIFWLTSAARIGEDAAFNKWYDEVHMHDVLKLPGFLTAQRYTEVDATASRPRYVAAYEVETNDPQATMTQLQEAGKNMVISPALDYEQVTMTILKPGTSAKRHG